MAITRLFKCKDFTVKPYYHGSRLKNGVGYMYEVIYHGEDGNEYHPIERGFTNKKEAFEYISRKVKKANAVLKKANEVGKVNLK